MCDDQSKKVKTSRAISCHHRRKKSPEKTQPDFLPSRLKQPMAFGGMRCPMDWKEVGEPHYDKPTSQVPPTLSFEHRRKKSTEKTKPGMASGRVRCPMNWKAVGEPHYDRPTSQVSPTLLLNGYRPADFSFNPRQTQQKQHIKELFDVYKQVTDMMGSSHSNNSMESCFHCIPKDGALSRFYPDRGDGVQKFQKLYMKDGRVVAGEEFQIISSD